MFKLLFPIIDSLREYTSSKWRKDMVAGITVAIMLIPQGMAYAYLAGMPPIYGLYAGIIPLFIYGLMGSSRHLSIGPVAISSLLILSGVSQIASVGSPEYINLVLLTGLLVGVFQFSLGLFRGGFLVNFLSHPVIIGFTSAAAIIIAISQLRDALGFTIPRFSHTYETFLYTIKNIDQTNWITLVVCFGSLGVMLLLRKISRAIPGALIVVLLGTIISYGLNLSSKGLAIVGDVPEGLPSFVMLDMNWEKIRLLATTVLAVGIIGIVESISIAKVLENKNQSYVIRPNQELLALGISKITGAFFQALPSSGSFTRSAVNNDSGAESGMSSIFTALIIALTLIFLTPLFYYLPKAVLAAIILLAVKSLFDFEEARHLWNIHKGDFTMMLLTFVITLVLGIEEGVIAGVLISLLAVLYRSAKPHVAVLGQLPGTTVYRNLDRFQQAESREDILIVRFDDQLYFSNAGAFKDRIKALVRERQSFLKLVILDSSSIHDIDSSGLLALEELFNFLSKRKVELYLCGVIGPVRDMLHKSGLSQKVGHENQFLKIHDAITYFKADEKDRSLFRAANQTNVH
jgi:SulP family sulfate permease